MKKYQNLILIMSLLFIIHLNAQEYVLKINYFKFDVERERILCGDNNKMELKVILKNGEEHLIRKNGGYYFFEKNIEKKYSSPIGSIYFYSFTHQEARADFFSCNGYSTGIKHSEPIRNICKNDIIRRESSEGTIKNTVVINYETYPIIKFDSFQENTIGYDTQCSIKLEKSSTHFPEDTYRYEYAIMENIPSERDWTEKNLPNTFKNTAFPSIKLSDFLPKTVIGNYIWFRAKSACGGTYRSNPIRFKILASTPDVISQGTISTKCPGGSIDYPLQFNRGLKSGEKLEVTIKYPDGRTKSIPNKDEKEFKLDANNVYIFKGLRKGIHSITISGEGDVYSSYAFRDHPFVLNVQDPDQLNFIDWARIDPSCYKGNDGYIIIGASGGTGNKQIKVNNDSWVPFNEDDHHSLKNLTAGEYKIRVKDVNECNGKLYSEDSEVLTITLSNPPQPQAVLDTRKTQQPTYHGAKNGKIVVELAGGTPLNRIILWKYKTIWKNA